MEKLSYCMDCRRIFNPAEQCAYCSSSSTKALNTDAPVNIIGSKLKGRVLKTASDHVKVLLVDDSRKKYIKEYKPSEIQKVL